MYILHPKLDISIEAEETSQRSAVRYHVKAQRTGLAPENRGHVHGGFDNCGSLAELVTINRETVIVITSHTAIIILVIVLVV